MGRNNADFEASALFHGTVHPFNEGDVVTPQGSSKYAYATPSYDYAAGRALQSVPNSWEDKKKENPDWNTPHGKGYDEYVRETPPRVYQVEPIDHSEHDEQGNLRSTSGFRVVKQVPFKLPKHENF